MIRSRKNKGFTLVELLAIIVIIAIVLLIAIPITTGILKDSGRKSFEINVQVAMDTLDEYLIDNGTDGIKKNGVTVQELNSYSKNNFISGKFIEKNGIYEALYVTDGKYCAKGPLDKLRVEKDCRMLDDTEAEFDSTKLHITSTSKTITVIIEEGFAIDDESGIKKYKVTIGDQTITKTEPGSFVFDDLTHNTDYPVIIEVTNGGGLVSTYDDIAATKEIEAPTYVVTPSGWAQTKNVKINYKDSKNAYNHEYSTDGGVTWHNYESPVVFTSNGTIIARVNDGKNYVTSSSQTVSQIDSTKPTLVSFEYDTTSKSITITASGADGESGIAGYQFSKDNGEHWTATQTSNVYTFNNLTTGTYPVQVKVVNGTYPNDEANDGNSLISPKHDIETVTINEPQYNVSPSGWSQSKIVTINYKDPGDIYTHEYSLDGGLTWHAYSSGIEFSSNGSIIARVNDGTNYVTASTQTITTIDTTKPTAASFDCDTTSKSITITAYGTDSQSGISRYQFSKDNGANYTAVQDSNVYTFDNLVSGTYPIKVKVINGTYANEGSNSNNTLESSKQDIDTISLPTPEYIITPTGWSQSKKVAINYKDSGNIYTHEYSLNGGKTWLPYNGEVSFIDNGTIIARVNDGLNYITSSSQTITGIDTTAPTAADFTYTATSKSLTLTASGTDTQSGIAYYQFSKDDGTTWTDPQESNVYKFDNLYTGTYKLKVKVINGTYPNNAVSANNSLESVTKDGRPIAIETPTYTVAPSGWAQSKNVTIDYNDSDNSYDHEYSIDGGQSWKKYTGAVSFTANGTIIARVNDGINYVTASSQTVSQIDATAPTSADFTYAPTSKSIAVKARGTDNESGISRYQFSKDGGTTWTDAQLSDAYTFDGLKTGTYSIKVRVINGTYANEGANNNNSLESSTVEVETVAITTPIYGVTPLGWSQSKTITITYPLGYTNEYSIDGGVSWVPYVTALSYTSNVSIIARVNDGVNYVSASTLVISEIDTSAPTAADFTYERTSRSITVTATGTDAQSGIGYYQFSKDGGATWTPAQELNEYTFDGLVTGTYPIKVKVLNRTFANNEENENNSLVSQTKNVSTITIDPPTYEVIPSGGWSRRKKVLVDYIDSKNVYTHQYSLDGGNTWNSYASTGVIFTGNGTIIARNTDGINYVSGSTQTISQIDRTAPISISYTHEDTTNSITLTASSTDDESGIYGYQFAITNKDSNTYQDWTTIQLAQEDGDCTESSCKYTFNGLQTGTYKVKARAINRTYNNNKIDRGDGTAQANGLYENYVDSEDETITLRNICDGNIPVYGILPNSGWSQSKTVTISRPSGCYDGTLQYSLDGGSTWINYVEPVTFTANGTIIAKITDGTNFVAASSQTITKIDHSTPTNAVITETHTSKSITVVARGTKGGDAPISYYQFSKDGGTTWTNVQAAQESGECTTTSCKYTFDNLTFGTNGHYSIKVRVINATYENNGLVETNGLHNYKDSSVMVVTLDELPIPTYSINVSNWARRKVVTIDYKDPNNLYTHQYSLDGAIEGSFRAYSSPIPFTANGTVIAQITDGVNYKTASSQTISQIDRTAPVSASLTYTATTRSITVTALGTDNESGIYGYQFAITNKDSNTYQDWTTVQVAQANGDCTEESCKYTFNNLRTGTYKVKVRAINKTYNNNKIDRGDGTAQANGLYENYIDSNETSISLREVCDGNTPRYSVLPNAGSGWAQSKSVTIDECSDFTLQYSLDGGNTFVDYVDAIPFTTNGTIIARVTDGLNYIDAASLTVSQIDRTTPTNSVAVCPSDEKSSRSITVTATGTPGGNAPISYYRFSKDNGAHWTEAQTSNKYEFTDLTSGSYQMKVEVINATYANNGRVETSGLHNYLESSTIACETVEIPVPEYSRVPNSDWARRKIVYVDYKDPDNLYTHQYSTDAGLTWNNYTNDGVEFTSSGTIIVKITDGLNYKTSSSFTITQVDPSAPVSASLTHTETTKSITVTATGTDNESGIYGYQFAITGKNNSTYGDWSAVQVAQANGNCTESSCKYTFDNLRTGTYKVKIRAINKTYNNVKIDKGTGDYPNPQANGLYGNYTDSTDSTVILRDVCDGNTPVFGILPSTGYAQSKTVTISKPSGCTEGTLQYSRDGGITWDDYTAPITFTSNGTIIGRVTDGLNYVDSASQTITSIDRTTPTNSIAACPSDSKTSRSITVTAAGTPGGDAPISYYRFSKDGGTTWTPIQSSNEYEFTDLTTGTYSMKVEVLNATYANNGKVETTGLHNYLQSSTISCETVEIPVPEYNRVPNSDWARRKIVYIDYKDPNNLYTHKYSTDSGLTWNDYTNAGVEFTSNGTIIAKNTDGMNYKSGSSLTITKVDTSAPTETSLTYTETTKSITVKAHAKDNESDIYGYQFAITGKDNSTYGSWTNVQASDEYTFNNLQTGTYKVKVRAINNTYNNVKVDKGTGNYPNPQADGLYGNYTDSSDTTVDVNPPCDGAKPTYSISPSGWAQSKSVSINFPSGCMETSQFTLEYSLNGGTTWNEYTGAVPFTTNGTVIARITDGVNYVTATSQTITSIDRTTPATATAVCPNESKTSRSITVTAAGTPGGSAPISYYRFSKDGGTTWTNVQESNEYEFTDLTTGSYPIKVEVINATYANEGKVETTGLHNYLQSSTISCETVEIPVPEYDIAPNSNWAKRKIVYIDYKDPNNLYTHQYSTDAGVTWNNYSNTGVEFTSTGTIIAKSTDGLNYKTSSSQTITRIDTSAPVSAGLNHSETTKSITVTATGTDGESGIYGYQFAITGRNNSTYGAWSEVQVAQGSGNCTEGSCNYTFDNLKTGTYGVKVRAINKTYNNVKIDKGTGDYPNPESDGLYENYKDSTGESVTLRDICDGNTPVFGMLPSSGWSQSKSVTISRPSGCTDGTIQYSLDGGITFDNYEGSVPFTANGTIIGRVTDGINYIDSASQTITRIDRTTPATSTAVCPNNLKTSRSITLSATGIPGGDAPISYYRFSKDGGTTWTEVQESNEYEFTDLTSGTYSMKVEVLNATYANNGRVTTTNLHNYLQSSTISCSTVDIPVPTYSIKDNITGWARRKVVLIDYKDPDNLYTHQYSTDAGLTWNNYSNSGVEFTSGGTIIAKNSDGKNYKSGSTQTITQVDSSAPNPISVSHSKTTKKITVTAATSDSESGIYGYQFAITGKNNSTYGDWSPIQKVQESGNCTATSCKYEFDNLYYGTYRIKVRAVNNTYANVKIDRGDGTAQPDGFYGNFAINDMVENESSITLDQVCNGNAPEYSILKHPGWAQSKTITINECINFNSDYKLQYSLDAGQTFVDYVNPVLFESNGSLIARVTDGLNYIDSSTLQITTIDRSTPTSSTVNCSNMTSRSITVTATGEDPQSGISRYRFSKDGGSTWTNPQESNEYVFGNLTSGTYQIKAEVINGTYVNEGIVETVGLENYLDSDSKSCSTIEIPAPTYEVVPNSEPGWARRKVVQIDYHDAGNSYTHFYSLEGGKEGTWHEYPSTGIEMLDSGTIIAKNSDGLNYKSGSSLTVAQIDTSAPTTVGLTHTETTRKITVTASGVDSESGIYGYQFAITKRNSSEYNDWTTVQVAQSEGSCTSSSCRYEFDGLQTGTYKIKVRAINKTYNNVKIDRGDSGDAYPTPVASGLYKNYKDSADTSITLNQVCNGNAPVYSISRNIGLGWAHSKIVTINRASGCTEGDLQYSLDGSNWVPYTEGTEIPFTANGTITARVTDGVNYIDSSTLQITKIDKSTPRSATLVCPENAKTSRSITVVASGTRGGDNEYTFAPITYYQFSKDGGEHWSAIQANSQYTFEDLHVGTYDMKVKVINATYENEGIVDTTGKINYKDSSVLQCDTVTIPPPELSIKDNITGWARRKIVEIDYKDSQNLYTHLYSTDGAVTWNEYPSNGIEMLDSGTIIAKNSDDLNYVTSSSFTVSSIDRTAPTKAEFTHNETTKSITVTATGVDNESDIYGYQFNITNMNGSTYQGWTDVQTSRQYTFDNLRTGTYKVKVRAINNTYNNVKNDKGTGTYPNPQANGLYENYIDSDEISILVPEICQGNTPVYEISPSGWAQSKSVMISFPSGCSTTGLTLQYNLDGGIEGSWIPYTEAVPFTANGTIIARVTDGVNYIDASSLTVSHIDRTAPTASTANCSDITSNSITVTATGTDAQSGIAKYRFSKDGGSSWTAIQTSNNYTFSNLTSGTYQMKVKVINSTYENEGIVETVGLENYLDSANKACETVDIPAPTYDRVPGSGWARRKIVYIDYHDSQNLYTHKYSIDAGETWNDYTDDGVEFTSTGTIIAKNSDGLNYKSGSSLTVAQIDPSEPTTISLTHTETTKSIKVTASGTDSESGIYGYQFAITGKDNSTYGDWTDIQSSNEYTFNNLRTGTYKVKVRAINNTYNNVKIDKGTGSYPNPQADGLYGNYKDSDDTTITLNQVCNGNAPLYNVLPNAGSGWAQSKSVTISRPSGCTEGTLQYSINGGIEGSWVPYTESIPFTANGSIIARVTDGLNYIDASSLTVAHIDRTTPTSASFTYEKTTKSITVTAIGVAAGDAPISFYQFSNDNGAHWTNVQSSDEYTFDDLSYGDDGAYYIKVRAINATYENEGLKASNIKNYAENTVVNNNNKVELIDLPVPEYEVVPGTVARRKVVYIDYKDPNNLYTHQYSLDGASSFSTYPSSGVPFTATGTVIAKVTDGINYKTGSSQTVTGIDRTAPTAASVTLSSKTTKSITVEAAGTDAESGIYGYQFKITGKDNSTYGNWSAVQTSNHYTYNNLEYGTYKVKVRAINGTYNNIKIDKGDGTYPNPQADGLYENYTESAEGSFTPKRLCDGNPPVFEVAPAGWATSKNVTISRAIGCPIDEGTIEYSLDGGNNWTPYTEGTQIPFAANGNIIARLTDGINYVTSASQAITQIDTTEPTRANVNFGAKTKTSVVVIADCYDPESDISKIEYKKGSDAWIDEGTTSSHVFSTLDNNTDYTFYVKCTNGAGLSKQSTVETTRTGSENITFESKRVPPSNEYTYAQRVTTSINYNIENITHPTRYLKVNISGVSEGAELTGITLNKNATARGTGTDPVSTCVSTTNTCGASLTSGTVIRNNTWYVVSEDADVEIDRTASAVDVYARINDGNALQQTKTITVSKIDTSAPSPFIYTLNSDVKTDRITIRSTCTDGESGNIKTEFKLDNNGWIDEGTNYYHTFTGLTPGNEHTFYVRCTNGAGLKTVGEKTEEVPEIDAGISVDNTNDATSHVFTGSYDGSKMYSPHYFIMTNADDNKYTQGSDLILCGDDPIASGCTGSTTISTGDSLEQGKWYMLSSGTQAKVTLYENGTVAVSASDGTNIMDLYKSLTTTHVIATCPSEMSGVYGTVDGNSYTVSISNDFYGGTLQYSTDNSTWSSTKPTRSTAGTTTVYVRVNGDSTHKTTGTCNSANIALYPAASCPTITNYNGTYDGNPHSFTVSGGVGTISYQEVGTSSWTTTIPSKTEPGTYYYKVKVESGPSSADCTASAASYNKITINKKNATCPTMTNTTVTYDGYPHSIGVSGGTGGTIKYSTDNTNWSTTNPSITNAGSQTVYVKRDATTYYNSIDCGSRTVTVNKAASSITCTGGSYSGSSINLVASSSGCSSISNQYQTNAGTYIVTCNGDVNHNNSTCSGTIKSVIKYSLDWHEGFDGRLWTKNNCEKYVSGNTVYNNIATYSQDENSHYCRLYINKNTQPVALPHPQVKSCKFAYWCTQKECGGTCTRTAAELNTNVNTTTYYACFHTPTSDDKCSPSTISLEEA